MAERPGGRLRDITEAARGLLEEEGPEALTMRRVAARIGIRAPSLYKHVPDKRALEVVLVADGMAELAAALEAAEGRAPGSLAALAAAYRTFALDHPHLYRLMNHRPLPRADLPAGLEDRAALPLLRAVGGDETAARAAWAFAHGMVALELDGRFPPGTDVHAAWATGLRAFAAAGAAPAPG